MQLGIDLTASTVRLAVTDGNEVRHTATLPHAATRLATLVAARVSLPAPLATKITGVRIAAAPEESDLRLAGIGLIRVAPPTMPALRPFASWPGAAGEALRARSALVDGGSDFVGNEARRADGAELRVVAERLTAAGADRLIVSAAGAPSAPWLEREAASEIAIAGTAPSGAWVTVAHASGGTGIREREHAAALNLGLADWGEDLARAATAAFPNWEVGFAHGLGGFGSGAELMRQPLGALHGVVRAAARGVRLVTGDDDFILALAHRGAMRLIGVTAGDVDRADVERRWGIAHNHLALDFVECDSSTPSDVHRAPEAQRMLSRRPGYPVIVVNSSGNGSSALEFATALGVTHGEITVSLERIARRPQGSKAGDDKAEALVEEAITRAILAGAAPELGLTRTTDVRPLAYVADPIDTVRVSVTGAPA